MRAARFLAVGSLLSFGGITTAAGRVAPASDLPPAKIVHLLNRLAFGPSPIDVATVQKEGIERWIELQLHPDAIPDPEVDAALRGFPALTMDARTLSERYPRREAPDGGDETASATRGARPGLPRAPKPAMELGRDLAAQKLIRAVESRRQLLEVLDDFWFNHFNVSARKGRTLWYLVPYERDVLRPHLFGKFRDLLGAVAHSPAMLFYLDNWTSTREGFERPPRKWRATRPPDVDSEATTNDGGERRVLGLNENYARELLELHTLGVRSGYAQADVREVARAFTGWSINRPREGGEFIFRPAAHDDGSKQVLTLPLASGGGREDGEAVLDFLARHPATAHHLAFKLCQRFVADDPPAALVERVAQVYLKSDGDLTEVYRALFHAPELWAQSAQASKTKTPLELLVSAVRSVGGTVDERVGPMMRTLNQLGQPLYQAQPPTGFAETADAWVSAGALVQRINLGIALAQGRMRGAAVHLPSTASGLDPAMTVDALAAQIVRRPLSLGTRETVVAALARTYDPGLDGVAPPLDVAQVVGLLWGSPEFQRQ